MATLRDFMEDQIPSQDLLGDPQWWWVLEVGDEQTGPAIVWTEELRFHAARNPDLVDDEGWLREEYLPRLGVVLSGEIGREVDVEEGSGDEPSILISVPLDVTLDSTLEEAAEAAWPVVATLTNVFDPGTFGAIYAMGSALTDY